MRLTQAADAAALGLEVPALAALRQHLEIDRSLPRHRRCGYGIDQARRQDLAAEIADPWRPAGAPAARPIQATLPPAMPIAPSRTSAERRAASHGGDGGVGEQQVEHADPPNIRAVSVTHGMPRPCPSGRRKIPAMALVIDALDHLVVNVRDVEVAAAWYQRVLGMTREDF